MNIATWKPVKEYAEQKSISVQAVYQAIKRGSVEMKKIGSYTLVRDK
jgi:predicted DNA-binding protein YlxM (UPF0122 family)